MPVEYVRDSVLQLDDEGNASETLVKVAWSEEYVQIASVARDVQSHEAIELPEGDGWYVTLDRRGINELIKKLRMARDRAYGRDE